MEQCSNLFSKVFDSGYGGCVRTCECGITHFDCYNTWDWEEGELERLQDQAKEHPDRYVEVEGSIGTMEIDNIQIVWGCSCDLAKKHERFIRNHASKLAQYLNEYATKLRKAADDIDVKGL